TGNPVTAGQAPDAQVAAMAPKPAQPGQLTSAEFLKQWREQKIGDLEGSVDVTAEVGRKIQASVAEVVSFATISLIDAESNSAAASTVSNGRGQFTLSMNGFIPDTGRAYYLEASKGLNGHMPGSPVVRFRTLVRWNGSSWESLSGSTISISSLTTAVSIAAQLAPSTFDPATLMNKINASVKPPILNRAPAAPTGFTDAQILGLATDVLAFLTANLDPIGALSDVAPAITYQSTDSARPGQTIEIRGKGFSPTASQNLVTFGGSSPGAVVAGGTERLFVIVPADAATGSLVVTTPRGAVTGMTFYAGRANPVFRISRWFPAATFYQPGQEVTLLGFGFSNVPSGNTVVVGDVTTTPSTCDEQFMVFKVPENATKGPISVRTSAGSSNELQIAVEFRPVVTDWFPRAGAPRAEFQLTGTNFGKLKGTVTIGNTGAEIVSWSDTEINAKVVNGSITGDLTITRSTGGAVSPGRFTVLSGNISGWTSSTTTNVPHGGGVVGRKGRFLYAAGGYSSANGYVTQTERCTLGDDGGMGQWSVQSGVNQPWYWNMYGGENPSDQAQLIGPYFYVYAGYNPNGYPYNAVNRAQILENGDFAGNFASSGITMSQSIYHVGYFRRIERYVYSFGGHWNTDIIQSAQINSDNTLQPFQNVSRLPSAIYGGHFARAGKYIYSISGYRPWDSGHSPGYLYRAEIDANGVMTSGFNYLNRTMPCDMYAGNVAVIGNYLYCFYGYNSNCTGGSWNYGYVYRAPLDANDNLGSFEQVTSMPSGAHYPNYVIVGNKIHLWGHYSNAHYGTIFTGTIN
ncbi:MAG: IPT/TIG domain-containing protein, partial [Candidatus Sericytochromatia bacterium]|nr:IPT/TIG domain-containing protein [Candidatus Sericytochromatia bacterium]